MENDNVLGTQCTCGGFFVVQTPQGVACDSCGNPTDVSNKPHKGLGVVFFDDEEPTVFEASSEKEVWALWDAQYESYEGAYDCIFVGKTHPEFKKFLKLYIEQN